MGSIIQGLSGQGWSLWSVHSDAEEPQSWELLLEEDEKGALPGKGRLRRLDITPETWLPDTEVYLSVATGDQIDTLQADMASNMEK